MPNYSKECQPIAGNITGLKNDVASLQKELQKAAPGEKSFLISQIKEAEGEIAKQQGLLDDCVKKHPYHPPPPPPPNPCLGLLKELKKLQNDLAVEIQKALAPLQKQLQSAAPGEKAGIIQEIKNTRADLMNNSPLAKEIAAKQKAYTACLTSHGGKLAMDAKFKGTATMWTDNSHAPGPFKQDVTIGLRFGDWDHSNIEVTDFPTISVTYDTHSPAGTVTTTVTLIYGSGTYDPQSHGISVTLDLYFHHSTSLAGDSRLHVHLGSDAPLSASGAIDLTGGAPFKGGYLDGNECSLEVKGKISPQP
jgi:hypothetical protein